MGFPESGIKGRGGGYLLRRTLEINNCERERKKQREVELHHRPKVSLLNRSSGAEMALQCSLMGKNGQVFIHTPSSVMDVGFPRLILDEVTALLRQFLEGSDS